MTQPPTPMLDKMLEARETGHSQEIGAFLEWLFETRENPLGSRLELAYYPRRPWCGEEHATSLVRNQCINHVYKCLGYEFHEAMVPAHITINTLLHEYFGIDPAEEEREKQSLLAYIRSRHEEA